MRSSTRTTGRRNGGTTAPCDRCLQRVQHATTGEVVELCATCVALLRPTRRPARSKRSDNVAHKAQPVSTVDVDLERTETFSEGWETVSTALMLPSDSLRSRLIQSLKAMRYSLQATWIDLSPALLGNNKALDLVVTAFCEATESQLERKTSSTTIRDDIPASETYGKALQSLRSSGDAFHGVPLDHHIANCCFFRAICFMQAETTGSSDPVLEAFMHWKATDTMLMLQSRRSKTPSVFVRSLFSDSCRIRWVYASILARPDLIVPFKSSYWYNIEPPEYAPAEAFLSRLQRASQRMNVITARIFAKILPSSEVDAKRFTFGELVRLYYSALLHADEAAENEALHHVHICKTADGSYNKQVPFSFDFGTARWYILVHYWATYLMVLQIRRVAVSCQRNSSSSSNSPLEGPEAVCETSRRLVSNILMAYQHAARQSMVARLQMIHPLSVLWRVASTEDNTVGWHMPTEIAQDVVLGLLQGLGVPVVARWDESDVRRATGFLDEELYTRCS